MDMSTMERRKMWCSFIFHLIAISSVAWSLYVLIDKTVEEVRSGKLQWPFWTKLVVVAMGFAGGMVFMYIQCKDYARICKKLRAYNRTIVVEVGELLFSSENGTLLSLLFHLSICFSSVGII